MKCLTHSGLGSIWIRTEPTLVPARPGPILCRLGFNFDGAAGHFTVPGLSYAYFTYPTSLVQCELYSNSYMCFLHHKCKSYCFEKRPIINFQNYKHGYLIHIWSDKALQFTSLNRNFLSKNEGSLQIMPTVPLKGSLQLGGFFRFINILKWVEGTLTSINASIKILFIKSKYMIQTMQCIHLLFKTGQKDYLRHFNPVKTEILLQYQ